MQNKKSIITKELRDIAIFSLIFGFIFAFAGWIIPELKYRNGDASMFYNLTIPDFAKQSVAVMDGLPNVYVEGKKFSACDTVSLITIRHSTVDSKATVISELILTKVENGIEKNKSKSIIEFSTVLSSRDGDATLERDFKLPCDLETGQYYFKGNTTFFVRGYQKVYGWRTQSFIIDK